MRWQHPRHGLIPPGAFIPLAEESQRIDALAEVIFAKAVAQLARWSADGLDLSCAVNFSPTTVVSDVLLES